MYTIWHTFLLVMLNCLLFWFHTLHSSILDIKKKNINWIYKINLQFIVFCTQTINHCIQLALRVLIPRGHLSSLSKPKAIQLNLVFYSL